MQPNFRKKFSNKKKPANKAEKIHMAKVALLGCIICGNNQVVLHHITTTRGFGAKATNFEVLPLCYLHHDGGKAGVAVHAGVKTWESKFGTQLSLLAKVQQQLIKN